MLVLWVATLALAAQPPIWRAGDEYHLTRSYETTSESGDEASASSRGSDVILERVVAVRDGGVELEYDLPRDADAAARTRQWQFPARVFRIPDGGLQLLNRDALESRLRDWLRLARMTEAACGRWIFTWNVFKIECDPQSVLVAIANFQVSPEPPIVGGLHHNPMGLRPGKLVRGDGTDWDRQLVTTIEVDPAAVRRAQAETDAVVAEITGRPAPQDGTTPSRSIERVSGVIRVTFDLDDQGSAFRRGDRTEMTIVQAGGITELRRSVTTVGRTRCPCPATARESSWQDF